MADNHSFTFNGISSTSFNIKIEQYRDLNRPSRKFKSYDIWGRNGNTYSLTDTFEEVEQSYQIFATDESQSSVELFGDIMEWLHSADGYAELTDTYDTTHYRMAVFVDSADISNSWNKYGRMVVTFRCRPERYLLPKETTSTTINNPTNHVAKPLYHISWGETSTMLNVAASQFNYNDDYDLSTLPVLDGYVIKGVNSGATSTTVANLTNYSITTSTGSISVTTSYAYYGVGYVIKVNPNSLYTLRYLVTSLGLSLIHEFYYYDEAGFRIVTSGDVVSSGTTNIDDDYLKRTTILTPYNCLYVLLVFKTQSADMPNHANNIQFNEGSVARDFSPYYTGTLAFTVQGSSSTTSSLRVTRKFSDLYVDADTEEIYTIDGVRVNDFCTLTEGMNPPQFFALRIGNNTLVKANSATVTTQTRLWEI